MKTFQKEIDATHPENDTSGGRELAADSLAMVLVGERHEKRELVNLVRWLLLQACDCGGYPHGKHCAAVVAGLAEHTPTTPNGD